MGSRVPKKKRASLPKDFRFAKLAARAEEMGLRNRNPATAWRAVDLYEKAALEAERNKDMSTAMWFQAKSVNFASILKNMHVARPKRKN